MKHVSKSETEINLLQIPKRRDSSSSTVSSTGSDARSSHNATTQKMATNLVIMGKRDSRTWIARKLLSFEQVGRPDFRSIWEDVSESSSPQDENGLSQTFNCNGRKTARSRYEPTTRKVTNVKELTN